MSKYLEVFTDKSVSDTVEELKGIVEEVNWADYTCVVAQPPDGRTMVFFKREGAENKDMILVGEVAEYGDGTNRIIMFTCGDYEKNLILDVVSGVIALSMMLLLGWVFFDGIAAKMWSMGYTHVPAWAGLLLFVGMFGPTIAYAVINGKDYWGSLLILKKIKEKFGGSK